MRKASQGEWRSSRRGERRVDYGSCSGTKHARWWEWNIHRDGLSQVPVGVGMGVLFHRWGWSFSCVVVVNGDRGCGVIVGGCGGGGGGGGAYSANHSTNPE